MPSTDWAQLKVVELKEECKKRGLAVSGKKADLVERLEAFQEDDQKSPEGAPEEPAVEEQQPEEAAAEEQPPPRSSRRRGAAAAAEEQPAAMEAEEAPAAAEEPAPAKAASPSPEPEPAAAAAQEQQPPQQEEQAAAAAEPMQEEQQPASPPAAKAMPAVEQAAAPSAAADVDLDYGEDSEGEGEGAAAAAAAPAAPEQRARRGARAEEPPKRKREEEAPAAAADVAPALARRLGARGPGAERALAQVASQSASAAKAAAGGGGGSAERPTKVARTASGLGTAEKGEAPAPEDVPPAEEATTRALRIDGFVRPFHERQVRELLGETGGVLALWMPSIKTHAYAVFESKEQAEATRRATWQLQWPATNPKRLAPKFVPLREAESAIGNGAGNPDFRLRRVEGDEPDEAEPAAAAPAAAAAAPAAAAERSAILGREEGKAAVDRSGREWNQGRRSPSPPLGGVRDLREMLSRKPSGGGAAGPAAAGAPTDLPPGLGARVGGGADRREGVRGEAGRRREAAPHPVRTLDELFNKTAAKPCIYWLPLTDQQVAEKKRKAAEEAAAKAAAGGGSEGAPRKENGAGAP